MSLTLFWTGLFLPSYSLSQIETPSGMTHGGEIELTNDWINEVDSPEKWGQLRGREEMAARQMEEAVRKLCVRHKCQITTHEGKWGSEARVTLPDGWWFQISWDPLCVEIQTKPSTLQELYKQQPLMEILIFKSARSVGLIPDSKRANHINTGIRSAFGQDIKKFWNYFVDNANHPELASGVLRKNWQTAPPLTALGFDPTKQILSIQHKIATGQIAHYMSLEQEIRNTLYSTHPESHRFHPYYNQDLNVKNLLQIDHTLNDLPFERRGHRAARSFHEFILQAELQESRIQWTKSQKGFIPFVYKSAHMLTKKETALRFQRWLKQMNLDMARYKVLVPKEFSRYFNVSNPSCSVVVTAD